MPRNGVFARVVRGGEVRPGESIRVLREVSRSVMQAAVVTVSDSASAGVARDTSGPAIAELIESGLGGHVAITVVLPDEQDEIAHRSHHNALAAWDGGFFDDYVVPVEIPQRRGDRLARHHRARGVIGVADKQQPRLGRHGRQHGVQVVRKICHGNRHHVRPASSRDESVHDERIIGHHDTRARPEERVSHEFEKLVAAVTRQDVIACDAQLCGQGLLEVIGAAVGIELKRVRRVGKGLAGGRPAFCFCRRPYR